VTVTILRFLLKAVALETNMLAAAFPTVALLSPRIPPFFGYSFCRLANDVLNHDLCRINEGFDNIPDVRGNIIVNIFRVIGAFITFVTYVTVLWTGTVVVLYEALPSVLFQMNCFRQFHIEASRSAFSGHAQLVHKHRQLQVLNIMFNNIYSRDLFLICMASVFLIVIPGGYLIITMHGTSPFASVSGSCITLTYSVVIVIFSIAGNVWSQSVEYKWAWKRNHQLAKNKLSRRYAKSLQHMKVKIGDTNFVEKNTPFVFVSFGVDKTVNLVLTLKTT
jgi:hypothetical protein